MPSFFQEKFKTTSMGWLVALSIFISVVITFFLTLLVGVLLTGKILPELLLINSLIGMIVPSIVAPVVINLIKNAWHWEKASLELANENIERKKQEEEAHQKALDMRAINELAIECAAATSEKDIIKLIAEKLRDIANALGVGITIYNPDTRLLTTRHVAVSGQILSMVNQLIGFNLVGMTNYVTPKMEKRMLTGLVESFSDLSEVSFGIVPKPVALVIKNTLGVGNITGMALSYGGKLIGTAIIATRDGQQTLNTDVCKTLAHVAAVSLQRQKTEDSLREGENKFRSIIENIAEGILLLNEQGEIIEWNPAQAELTGFKREDVLGKPIWDIQFQLMPEHHRSPEFFESMKQQTQQILESGTFSNFNRLMEGMIFSLSGEMKYILQASFPVPTDTGFRVGSIMRDVSFQKAVEKDRDRVIAELKAKNAELEQFTYTVSHDLKAPIITIKGFLGFLEKDVAEGNKERTQKDVERISEATDKMYRLLNELLALSRVGRFVEPSQKAPFERIVQDAIALVQGRLNARGVRVELAKDLPNVYVDQARLVQALQNLLDNSAKFMGGQSKPLIEIGAQGNDQNGKPIFFVRDNGIGIESNQLENVFGLFQKLDINVEGTGVGLALVKRIIEVHGGKIWLTSDGIGKGTTVYFTLPLP